MRKVVFILFIWVGLISRLPGQLRVHEIFCDHMVLQRELPVKIWGWSKPDSEVQVSLNGETGFAKADKNGKWLVQLPGMKAGGSYDLLVESDEERMNFTDILIGDIWICSGQSNMEMTVAESDNAQREIAVAGDDFIRHIKIDRDYSKKQEEYLDAGNWEIATSESVGSFTAVGYFFAKELRKNTRIPIGLVNSTWGGSRIETWMNPEALGFENPEKEIEEAIDFVRNVKRKAVEKLMKNFPGISTVERGIKNNNPIWADPKLNEREWQNIIVPGIWEGQGYEGFDGIAWYRKTFELSKEEANEPVKLSLGKIDDSDITWINWQKTGGLFSSWNEDRLYEVPADLLKKGKNKIAIRVEDTGGGGGIHGDPKDLFVQTSKRKIPLSGNWKFHLDAIFQKDDLANPHHLPTLCYNKMIYPINDFPAKGVIWYQGESNAGNPEEALKYEGQFKKMITQWRKAKKQPDLPFLFVQLANFFEVQNDPGESSWALLRESQTKALELKNTARAVIIDIGEAEDIHPKNKQDVGLRLSLAARNIAYGEKVAYQSPVFENLKIENTKIIISFKNVANGLKLKNGDLEVKGFAIAGKDKKFVWAKTTLQDNKVTVWSNKISSPKYVRYAWADNPGELNLYNSAGLPATPFRTDVENF